MKWKILIKFLYLIILLAFVAMGEEKEPLLIDSDPTIDQPSLLHASLRD
ncbi:MAG: hypothetical protein ABJP45_11590 [Cyclobacteriaceae bacterium]